MAYLGRKTVGAKSFYYLEQSFRLNGTVHKREKFIGTTIPQNIENLKSKFAKELRAELMHPPLEGIKKGFTDDKKSLPRHDMDEILEDFALRFTYDSNRIEGSALSLKQVTRLIKRNKTPAGKSLADVLEANAHYQVFREMLHCKKDLSLQLILYWHDELYRQTKPDMAGALRTYQVYISGSGSVLPPPVEVHPLLTEMFKWYGRNKKLHPVELAAVIHLKFESIHPFGDGNGRVGRLMMNFVLQRNGWPMMNIPYEKRYGYYNALERSQTRQDEDVFIQWFFRSYLRENERYRR